MLGYFSWLWVSWEDLLMKTIAESIPRGSETSGKVKEVALYQWSIDWCIFCVKNPTTHEWASLVGQPNQIGIALFLILKMRTWVLGKFCKIIAYTMDWRWVKNQNTHDVPAMMQYSTELWTNNLQIFLWHGYGSCRMDYSNLYVVTHLCIDSLY